jgi:hypothetical protein
MFNASPANLWICTRLYFRASAITTLTFTRAGKKTSIVSQKSAASLDQSDSVVLTYFRSQEQAEMVERLMGKENIGISKEVDTYCHPVIELRLTPEHFVIELVLSPKAWWDQQNFIGKLDLPQHRATFRNLLRSLDHDYRLGFWGHAP